MMMIQKGANKSEKGEKRMKITRRILQEIVKEEVSGVLFEKKLSDGSFVGLSGYKFHTNPNDWRVVDSVEEAEERASLMNIPKDGKAHENEVLSQEIVAADDRGFLKKFYDKIFRKPGRSQDKYYFRQDKNYFQLGADVTPNEIGKHATKVFAELILRYILGSPDGSEGQGYLYNTFFYEKPVMSFEEFQKYVAKSLFGIQSKGSKSQQYYLDADGPITKPFIDIVQWDDVANQMSEGVWNNLLAQAEKFAQQGRDQRDRDRTVLEGEQ